MALTRITRGVIKPNENYDTHNIVSTGIVTSVGLDVNGNADVSGNLSVGGVLTYEDVTSIDSLGIITARSGIDADDFISVGSNIHLGNAGVITATSFVGDGSGLIGVASTDNIITGTAATFNTYPVDINAGMTVAGVSTFASNVYLGDNDRLYFGDDNDLQIWHSSTYDFIQASGNAGFFIRGTNNTTLQQPRLNIRNDANTEDVAKFIQNGAVELYYDNAKKFETTTNGIDITGSSTFAQLKLKTSNGSNTGGLYGNSTSLFLLDGQDHQFMHCVKDGEVIIKHDNSNILKTYTSGVEIIGALYATSVDLNDNQKILLGTGDDLEIYHNGSDTYIDNDTGRLLINTATGEVQINKATSEYMARFIVDGAVELYHNNVKKLETGSTGVTVTGNVDAGTGSFLLSDDGRIRIGTGFDFELYHDGNHSIINDSAGSLLVRSNIVQISTPAGSKYFKGQNGIANLYYLDSKKLETSLNGIAITGGLTVSGVCTATTFSGSGASLTNLDITTDTSPRLGGTLYTNGYNIFFADAEKATFGNASDLEIYHDGSNSKIVDSGSGSIVINTSRLNVANAANSEGMLNAYQDGQVELNYDGSIKFQTISTGGKISSSAHAHLKITSANTHSAIIHLGDTDNDDEAQIWYDNSAGGMYQRVSTNHQIMWGTNNSFRLKLQNDGHLCPYVDSTYDLGRSSNRFRNVYADTLYGDGSNLTGITQTTINSNTNNYVITGTGTANTLQGESTLTFDGTKLEAPRIDSKGLIHIEYSSSTNTNYMMTMNNNNGIMHIFRGDALYIGNNMNTSNQGSGPNNRAISLKTNGDIINTGNITASGYVDSASDIKLKTNIKTIDNALDKVLQLRGAEYDRIDKDNQHEIGVIAQEVEKIIPEVVHGDETKTVSYGNMVAVLIEAIKEQNSVINKMKKEIEDLKG